MTQTTMKTLAAEAARCGATLALAYLDPPLRGHYDVERGEIVADIRLTREERMETIAHEIGHARNGDTCSDDLTERRAWRQAASLLVDLDAYRAAEAIEADPQFIADEIGVTRHIVRIFQREILPSLSLSRGA